MVLPSHSFFHSAVGSGFLVAIPSSGLWRWFSLLILPFGGGVWVFGGDSLFGFVEVVLSSHSSIWWWGLGFWWRFPLRVCGGGSFFLFFHSAEGSGFLVAIPSSGLWRWFSLLILPFGGGVWVFGGDSLFGFVEVVLSFLFFHSAVGSGFLVAIPSSGLWRWLFFLSLRFFHSAVGSGFLVAIPSSGLWRWFSFLILPFGGGVWVFGGDSLFGFVEVVLFFYSSIRRWGLGFWWRFPLRVCGGGSLFSFFHSAEGSGFLVAIPSSGLWRWFFFLFFHSAVGSGFLVAIPSSGLLRWFSLLILPFGGGAEMFLRFVLGSMEYIYIYIYVCFFSVQAGFGNRLHRLCLNYRLG